MKNVVLRTNAIPVYGFLSVITAKRPEGEALPQGKILDCGAGGPVPPLALFHQHGFEGWGIDMSEGQLDKARQFCEVQGIELHLRQGDMRRIPFEDETFDYVYEHYSMCHLSKQDTVLAVREMHRVLKRHEYKEHYPAVVKEFRFGQSGSKSHMWQAWRAGQPVAKAGMYLGARSVGVYAVATRPEARRLGLARTLTLTALHEARSLGYRLAVLHSTPMAESLYRSLGFATIAEFRLFASEEVHV